MDAKRSGGFHGSLPAIVATVCMSVVLAPFAYSQFGPTGPITIAAFVAAIVVSVLVAAWGATQLSHRHPLLAGLFASSGIRMVAPFGIALVVVLGRGSIVPIETVYYVVPLYLSMLLADVMVWVREAKTHSIAADARAKPTITTGEGV